MIHRQEAGDKCGYAQAGWWEAPYSVRHTFIEWTSSGCPDQSSYHTDATYDPYPIGESINYKVLYDNTPGDFTFYSDNVAIGLQTADWTPDEAQQYGEIHTLSSQMPGGSNSNAHEDISSAYWYYSGGWHSLSAIISNQYNNYFGEYPNTGATTDINIWDYDCPS